MSFRVAEVAAHRDCDAHFVECGSTAQRTAQMTHELALAARGDEGCDGTQFADAGGEFRSREDASIGVFQDPVRKVWIQVFQMFEHGGRLLAVDSLEERVASALVPRSMVWRVVLAAPLGFMFGKRRSKQIEGLNHSGEAAEEMALKKYFVDVLAKPSGRASVLQDSR